MRKYPISLLSGKINDCFNEIITLHGEGKNIIDVTCGRKYFWKDVEQNFSVIFSDIRDFGDNIVSDFRKLKFERKFDVVVFDPPYLFGIVAKNDEREIDYGNYSNTYEELMLLIETAPKYLMKLLVGDGIVVLKCSDMFWMKTRKFYPLSFFWQRSFSKYFDIIDVYIYAGHRISPTAFQVKNRGCCVNTHGYFYVFKRKE